MGLGSVHFLQGRYGPATDWLERALAIARQSGDRRGQLEAHQDLGRVCYATNRHQAALLHHHTALRLALDLDQPVDQALVHDRLARTHDALGNPHQARYHWQTALDLLTAIGTDHTKDPVVTTAAIRLQLSSAHRDGDHGERAQPEADSLGRAEPLVRDRPGR